MGRVEGKIAIITGAVFMAHNVADEELWIEMVRDTLNQYSNLDILMNNAGIGSPNVRPEHAGLDQWRSVQSVNLEGTFLASDEARYVNAIILPVDGGLSCKLA